MRPIATATRCASSWSRSAARSFCGSWPCTSSDPTSVPSRRSRRGRRSRSSAPPSSGRRSGSGRSPRVTVIVLALLYRKTTFGRAMRATSIRRDAARLVGIDARAMVTASFALAAALGALGGLAVAPLTQTAFDVGAGIGVKGFAAAILGGLGNPVAAVGGRAHPRPAREPHGRIPRPASTRTPWRSSSCSSCCSCARRACSAGRGGRRCDGQAGRSDVLAPLVAAGGRRGRAAARHRPLPSQDLHLRRASTPWWSPASRCCSATPARCRSATPPSSGSAPTRAPSARCGSSGRGCSPSSPPGASGRRRRAAARAAESAPQRTLPGDGDARLRRAHDARLRRGRADHGRRRRLRRHTRSPRSARIEIREASLAVLARLGDRGHRAAGSRPT